MTVDDLIPIFESMQWQKCKGELKAFERICSVDMDYMKWQDLYDFIDKFITETENKYL